MIHIRDGNLIQTNAEALVNTVNCVGVMGKGIALQFKQAFPDNFKLYEKACREDQIQIGKMFVVSTDQFVNPKYIINFPTKKHWRNRSKIEYIKTGLQDLIAQIKDRDIKTIAVPPLGCGNGGLDWHEVRQLIESAFEEIADVQVSLYEPHGAPDANKMPVGTEKPHLTSARALFIKLIDLYCIPGYRMSLIEIQKLAYFLQAAGQPLKLQFVRDKYGPYAENLNFVLQRLEGHYIRGYGDRSRKTEVHLLPEALNAAETFLEQDQDATQRLNRVSNLIEGFETPYGLELLGTVHWLSKENENVANNVDIAVKGVRDWNKRKKEQFKPLHIEVAWKRLQEQNWF